jgi:hypothetical protein
MGTHTRRSLVLHVHKGWEHQPVVESLSHSEEPGYVHGVGTGHRSLDWESRSLTRENEEVIMVGEGCSGQADPRLTLCLVLLLCRWFDRSRLSPVVIHDPTR